MADPEFAKAGVKGHTEVACVIPFASRSDGILSPQNGKVIPVSYEKSLGRKFSLRIFWDARDRT